MKLWKKVILLIIIDFLLIWLWVRQADPDPSISIGILLLFPIAIGINLIIAIIMYFTKRKYAILFILNSFIAGILMFYLFNKGIDRHEGKRLESWKFYIGDTTFVITHWKVENTFNISESTSPGSSFSLLDGKYSSKGNEYYLVTDSTKYKIKKKYFYGFRDAIDSIKLTRIER